MRILAVILAACIVLLQWPLWIGKGSWLKVWQIETQLAEQKQQNTKLQSRNDAMNAEVRDLKTGTDAIEERARNELGMVRQDEVFFQILDSKPLPIATTPVQPPAAPPAEPAATPPEDDPEAAPQASTPAPAASAPATVAPVSAPVPASPQ